MGNYNRTHKRLAGLDDVDDVAKAVGSRSENYVTVVDPYEPTGDDDFTVPGNRLAALTTSGVVYADQLPGVYGPQAHVITGEMRSDGFYETGSDSPVVPDVSYVYLDNMSKEHNGIAYRWLEKEQTYVVSPNNFRLTAGSGLVLSVETDAAHKSASMNVRTGSDTLPAECGDMPDNPGTPSLLAPEYNESTVKFKSRSVGFDSAGNLVHILQPTLAAKTAAQLTVGASNTGKIPFGGQINAGAVMVRGHVTEVSQRTVTLPSSLATASKAGLSKTGVPSAIGKKSSPGTVNGKVSYADHVHGCEAMRLTGTASNANIESFSLGDKNVEMSVSSILKIKPPTAGPSVPKTVFRTSDDNIAVGSWGDLGGGKHGGLVSVDDVSISILHGDTRGIYGSDSTYLDDGKRTYMSSSTDAGAEGSLKLAPGSVYRVTGLLGISVPSAQNGYYATHRLCFTPSVNGLTPEYIKNHATVMGFTVDLAAIGMTQWYPVDTLYYTGTDTPWVHVSVFPDDDDERAIPANTIYYVKGLALKRLR